MESVREFLESVGKNAADVSLLEVAEECGMSLPLSLKELMEGGSCLPPEEEPPPPDGGRQTVNFTLHRQEVGTVEGGVAYVAYFNQSGVLRSVTLPNESWATALFFVTGDCTNPEAVVRVNRGETIGADELSEIYGTSEPPLPAWFFACISTPTITPARSVWIKVTYDPV